MLFNPPSFCGRCIQAITIFSEEESSQCKNTLIEYLLPWLARAEERAHTCTHSHFLQAESAEQW